MLPKVKVGGLGYWTCPMSLRQDDLPAMFPGSTWNAPEVGGPDGLSSSEMKVEMQRPVQPSLSLKPHLLYSPVNSSSDSSSGT
jgi:hypothetical protein